METHTPPPILYKYRDWADSNHQKVLAESEIYFSSVSQFNDPFDCNIPIRYDLASEKYHRERMNELLQEDFPGLSIDELICRATEKLQLGIHKNKEHLQRIWQMQRRNIERKYGVFSASAVRDNMLMWSRYANNHKGYCVGFDRKKLFEFWDELADRDILIDDVPVIYTSVYPILNPETMDNEAFFLLQFQYKSIDWSYEKEYRFIYHGKSDYPLRLPDGIIKEIYLGCLMSDEHAKKIRDLLGGYSHRPRLYKAIKSMEAFELDFEEIALS